RAGPCPAACDPSRKKAALLRPFRVDLREDSALAGLEARVGLADHEDLAAAADHLAVAVTILRRLQGGQDLHDGTSATVDWWNGSDQKRRLKRQPPILA